jgi:general secretion pathway protein D
LRHKLPAILVALLLTVSAPAQSDQAQALFKRARQAERRGDDVGAYLLYSQARAQDPGNRRYLLAASAVRERAGQMLASIGNRQAALALDPSNAYLLANAVAAAAAAEKPEPSAESLLLAATVEPRTLRAPTDLQPTLGTADFRLRDTIRSLYEKIAERFGLIVIFDADFQGEQTVKFEIEGVSFAQAIFALNDVASAFLVPVNSRVFLIAGDTAQKRAELEPMATAVLPLSNLLGPEQLTELGQAVQQVLEIKRFQVDNSSRQVLIRDTVSRVRLARELYEHLAQPKAEAVIDVDLITIDEDRQTNLGIGLPGRFPITNFSTILWNAPPAYDGSVPLLGIGGGSTVFGVAIGTASLIANRLATLGAVRSSFSVRAADGMPASFLVGERYPVVNARFSAIVTNDDIQDEIDEGTFREPFPSFTFEDLGLVFNVTAHIHSAREISLDLETDVKQLTGRSINDIPVLSSRQMKSFVRLRQGEVALITGMAVVEQRRSRSGLALLSEIPFLGHLFSRHAWQYYRSHLIVVVRPRIVRLPPAEMMPELTLRYGPESRPLPPI